MSLQGDQELVGLDGESVRRGEEEDWAGRFHLRRARVRGGQFVTACYCCPAEVQLIVDTHKLCLMTELVEAHTSN